MSKKNLDELFQEKFLDFKEMPDERVWQSIEASLNRKKKKGILPLWWQLGGIAAALVLGLLLFNPFGTAILPENQISDVNPQVSPKEHEDDTNKEDSIRKEEAVEAHKDDVLKKSGIAQPNNNDGLAASDAEHKKEQLGNATPQKRSIEATGKNPLDAPNGTIAVGHDPLYPKDKTGNMNKNDATEQIVKKEVPQKENGIATTHAKSTNQEMQIQEDSNITNRPNNKVLPNTSNNTAIAQQKVEKQGQDTPPEEMVKKSIFENLEISDQEALVEKPIKRWSAGPSIAPVYFNALGQGSPVHSIFVPNSKSGEINLSYGVTVAYAISNKLSVRSGLHRVDYGYDTNDIAFSSSLVASTNGQIDNIDYRPTSKNLVLSSKTARLANNEAPSNALDASAQNPAKEGIMSQQFGYLELPVELNYALLDRKFGLNLIGGFSSLLLTDNTVELTSGTLTMEMGEANNINSLNFSTNIGLGMNYKFNQNLQLNIEPMFKYQLNTFSETDGTFRPYSIGVYSGLSFRF
jgi:hypothetical protein